MTTQALKRPQFMSRSRITPSERYLLAIQSAWVAGIMPQLLRQGEAVIVPQLSYLLSPEIPAMEDTDLEQGRKNETS